MIEFEKFISLLSRYLDEELDRDICEEMDELMNEDFFCENLFNTFRKTMEMCRKMEMLDVPEDVHHELSKVLMVQINSIKIKENKDK